MDDEQAPRIVYSPEFFNRETIEEAKAIILTDEVDLTSEQRWQRETPWLMERMTFDPGLLLDIGCGIGRMAQRLVLKDHPVIGVDISEQMRAKAELYVHDPGHFTAMTASMLGYLVDGGLVAQGALAVWALQHMPVPQLKGMVALMARALVPGATLWTVEHQGKRFVPAMVNDEFRWVDDNFDVAALLNVMFLPLTETPVPTDLCAPGAVLRRWARRRAAK